ncbi:MAG: OmpA family protein [Fimbriimonadaceae bacterium]|nr:OmpA family protein [Fimbriimonadaceae bacterium]
MQDGTPIIIKKVKKHGHGHHGGAWKVAYADFVTAMMAFFMVMWILGMSEDQKRVIASYFRDPVGVYEGSSNNPPNLMDDNPPVTAGAAGSPTFDANAEHERKEGEKVKKEVEEKIQKDENLKPLLQTGAVTVDQTAEGVQIELIENETNGEVFFQLGSAEIRPKARELFNTLAPVLAQMNRKMFIDGHTDARPMAGGMDNYDLSSARANAVRRLLQLGGVKEGQILEVRGKADKEPRVPDDPYHFSNRRVSIVMPYKYMKQVNLSLPQAPASPESSAIARDPRGVLPSKDQALGPKPTAGGAN